MFNLYCSTIAFQHFDNRFKSSSVNGWRKLLYIVHNCSWWRFVRLERMSIVNGKHSVCGWMGVGFMVVCFVCLTLFESPLD